MPPNWSSGSRSWRNSTAQGGERRCYLPPALVAFDVPGEGFHRTGGRENEVYLADKPLEKLLRDGNREFG